MSISYSPTSIALSVEIKPSNYFRALLLGIALAALGAIFYAQLIWSLRLLLATLTLLYTGYCWRTQMRQRGVLQWRSAWLWRGANGIERALHLRHSTVWPGLIVLFFYDVGNRGIKRGEKFVLTLLADSFNDRTDSFARANNFDISNSDLSNDSARRLRVHLNHFPVFDTVALSISDESAD